jgi:hypothetical protein
LARPRSDYPYGKRPLSEKEADEFVAAINAIRDRRMNAQPVNEIREAIETRRRKVVDCSELWVIKSKIREILESLE